ncbi:PEP-CTERM sorting domain-containing protein [Akkermansiaceae bacterium]|nr:PEP-CTERM sorting domain-containing protein [Akkermansiaceae bacterium]MDB4545654.1 PEP-CTERM sorting domain-containing protein [Akkermansiaceae bacterium]
MPEPSAAALLGLGGLALLRRRRKATPFLPHPIRSKGGFKALPPQAMS